MTLDATIAAFRHACFQGGVDAERGTGSSDYYVATEGALRSAISSAISSALASAKAKQEEAVRAVAIRCAEIVEVKAAQCRENGERLMQEGFHPQTMVDREAALSDAAQAIRAREVPS